MSDLSQFGFHDIFIEGDKASPVFLLLHGTGGDENDLVDLGKAVAPNATLLSIRGKVLENGMPRFFKRLAEGVFDQEDLALRTKEMAEFITAARSHYDIEDRPLYALGFSNGANIAASLLLRNPEALDGAILLRAMIPFEPETLPDLSGKKILLSAGLIDQIIPAEQSKRLAGIFEEAKAHVKFTLKPVGHGLVQSDVQEIKQFLSE
jgi:phospholipase/carboxylesterase